MSSIVSYKSAITTRVNPQEAEKLYSESRTLGNVMMCPASAVNINMDEYQRPVGGSKKNTLLLDDASCSSLIYPTNEKIRNENAIRPMFDTNDRTLYNFMYGNGVQVVSDIYKYQPVNSSYGKISHNALNQTRY